MASKNKSWGSLLDLNNNSNNNSNSNNKEMVFKSPLGMRRMRVLEQKQDHSSVTTTNTNNNNNGSGDDGGKNGGVVNNSSGSSGSSSSSMAMKALAAKKQGKAMAIAMGPGKQIMMNGVMMYMSGNTLNMFSISICSMAILTPLTSLIQLKPTFKPLEDGVDLTMPKVLYLVMNLIWLAVGLYKMKSMQLLPSTSADYNGRILW
eukprot:CAMPEP_0197829308 /NCGR_PEP_ID=MMETSP1437-20131217/5748_1 /TAXON_ID=49252 ORGANISM="Eucampia antarctica, Strain CCMP1452" /NCGR_SAMPLE_ID=MMETSP1437 /ASSEMBLY_ACC=CAM_ASM_001096 /LENGTH=203 /DNA_ID=CAMNT_0043430889 /DNA_START=159 /DNA_END=767 /DNA_ORIENTATION=+